MPGLKAAEIDGRLEAAGIDKVYVFCVNDGAVMSAWKKAMGLEGSDMIEFLADTHGDLTEALEELKTCALEVRLKEREVTKIYDKEMTRLAGAGKKAEARLLRDEENAETTLLAQEKEAEIRKKLKAVQDSARLKAQQLQAQQQQLQAAAPVGDAMAMGAGLTANLIKGLIFAYPSFASDIGSMV